MPVVDTKFELSRDVEFVLKIGRDYQNKDGFRGAHYDTVKLLCDTIEYLRDKLPKPDPDWKAICEKCHDGEIEPKCEYYGEPNGCNSPIYGEHPKASLGNNPAMREALATVIKIAAEMRGEYEIADSILKDGWATQVESIAKAALSIPARNCDRFQTKENAAMAFNRERSVFIPQSLLWQLGEWLDWLFAPATDQEGVPNAE